MKIIKYFEREASGNMAEETIYLCNFRVSVDGDWLCLKELTDVHVDMVTHEEEEGQSFMTNVVLISIVCPKQA